MRGNGIMLPGMPPPGPQAIQVAAPMNDVQLVAWIAALLVGPDTPVPAAVTLAGEIIVETMRQNSALGRKLAEAKS